MTLSKTSVQLPPETLKWLERPDMTKSEALRLALERAQYLTSQMGHVEDLANKYMPILAPALEEFRSENFRIVNRALPALVGSYIQENTDQIHIQENTDQRELDAAVLYKELDAMHPAERMHLLDCVVMRRYA